MCDEYFFRLTSSLMYKNFCNIDVNRNWVSTCKVTFVSSLMIYQDRHFSNYAEMSKVLALYPCSTKGLSSDWVWDP